MEPSSGKMVKGLEGTGPEPLSVLLLLTDDNSYGVKIGRRAGSRSDEEGRRRRTRPVDGRMRGRENKDRCEENFSKAHDRLGMRRNLPRNNAESEVHMAAGAAGRVAPLTHANSTPLACGETLEHRRRCATEVRAAPPALVSTQVWLITWS